MLKLRRPSGRHGVRAVRTIAAVVALGLAGCSAHRPGSAGPAPTAREVYQSLLGRNPGLTAVRAVAEARLSYAGREVSLPGALLLDGLGGFRLELLDPLDRPLAILFAEGGRVVHYRPGQRLAASLGVFPEACRGVDPADWVPAILSASLAPVAGERLAARKLWGGARVLERHRGVDLRQSIRYGDVGGQLLPRQIAWYCGEEPVLELRLLEWVLRPAWSLPSRFEVTFPKAGLAIKMELSEIEGNPPPAEQAFRPLLGPDIRWTAWNLPE